MVSHKFRPSSPSAYISLQELNSNQREDRTYVSFRTIPDRDSNSAPEFSSHTMPKRYPSLSPFIAEMKTEERSEETMELDRESSEVEELCRNKKFPSWLQIQAMMSGFGRNRGRNKVRKNWSRKFLHSAKTIKIYKTSQKVSLMWISV